MTKGNPADGAPARRLDALDAINTCDRLSAAALRLGQVARLHEAEARRAIQAGTGMTAREVADAWVEASALLVPVAAELDAVQRQLAAQMPAIAAALDGADPAIDRR